MTAAVPARWQRGRDPWQDVGSRAREAVVVEYIRRRQEVGVGTRTTDQRAEIRRHIDELEARADAGTAQTRARLQAKSN
jgi:hypothetical protein